MGKPVPKTIGESLYWSYSNLGMMSAALIPLSQAEEYKDTLPFSLEHIPHNFPKVAELCAFVQPTTEPSPETKAKMAAELGRGLSEALEQAAREHEDEESPDVS